MLARLYKLRPLGKQTKKIVPGHMNEGVEICGHQENKPDIFIYTYTQTCGHLVAVLSVVRSHAMKYI